MPALRKQFVPKSLLARGTAWSRHPPPPEIICERRSKGGCCRSLTGPHSRPLRHYPSIDLLGRTVWRTVKGARAPSTRIVQRSRTRMGFLSATPGSEGTDGSAERFVAVHEIGPTTEPLAVDVALAPTSHRLPSPALAGLDRDGSRAPVPGRGQEVDSNPRRTKPPLTVFETTPFARISRCFSSAVTGSVTAA
jgi:hypothetical protein